MRLKVPSSLLTAGEEIGLARRVHGPDPADAVIARNELVTRNLGLVGRPAAYYARKYRLEYDELFSEGMLALIAAAQGFDPARHFRFSTYACKTIVHELKSWCLESALVRVPNYLQDRRGRPPAKSTDPWRKAIGAQCLARSRPALAAVRSLSEEHYLADPAPPAADTVIARESIAAVIAALGQIPPLRAYILAHRRGLCGLPVRTLDSLAVEIGLTRERIRQIEVEAGAELAAALARIKTLARAEIL